ncbi:amine oxidase [flavin-containing] B-like [Tachypleus tridentatus]|uniref:amine oxidase [flavin-containing] B-like n=1 Tax=Tachypleus tridentatus TaxID=6853 RepID=UPI003FD24A2A
MLAKQHQVIVIGAGLSGLCAAKLLHEWDIDVIVLEARERVGGRTLTKRDPNLKYVDLGGSYVGPTQNRLLRLAKEFGIETYKVNEKEDLVFYDKGFLKRFNSVDALPRFWNPLVNLDLNHIWRTIDKMGEEIPSAAPWKAPNAEKWDRMTVRQFLEETSFTKTAQNLPSVMSRVIVATEPYESSLLWFLWYVKQCGGINRIASTTNGGQERKFVGGTQQFSENIAKRLGDRVLLNKPAVSISYQEDTVKVKTLDGDEYQGKYIILAISPILQMKIHFNPPLPLLRNQLIQRTPMGSVMKCILYYKTPFWREKGYCGSMIVNDTDEYPVSFSLDDTKPDGSVPAIIGFVVGDKLRRLASLSSEERKQLIARSYSKILKSPEALQPIHYEEFNWMGEQYSGGCYTGTCPPGFLTCYGRVLREPIGRMYFAGTETATYWSGYLEGAIEAGERSAREVLNAMGLLSSHLIWQEETPSDIIPIKPFKASFLERNLPSARGLLKLIAVSTILEVAAGGAFYYSRFIRK